MKKKKFKIIAIIIVVVVVALIGFNFLKPKTTAPTMTTVRTYTLQKGSYSETISANGTVSSTNSTSVTTSLNYDIATIEVAVGDQVEEGDTIVTLDTSDLLTDIEREEKNAEDQKEKLRQSLEGARLNKETSWNDFAEKKEQYEAGKLDYNDYIKASNDFGNANQNYINAQKEYDEYEDTQLEDLYEQLENCNVKAKSSGTIVSLNATVGSPVSSNSAIATIADVSSLEVSVTLDEYDIQKVSKGMKATITTDAVDASFTGTVTAVAMSASSTGTGNASSGYKVTVTFDETNETLLLDMNVKVQFILDEQNDVYQVPNDAIGEENGEQVIYVEQSDGTFSAMAVKVTTTSDYYSIIEADTLTDGMVIRASANEDEATVTESNNQNSDTNFTFDMGGGNGGAPGNMNGGPRGGF